eukprot:CAMPEP_0168354760 /NCGR_PEP_ID=MMETSP0213-20121227/24103_1 /TAXON_ID=151035 /ORGANISM="Euplotes harpa, Strain FSP1.4" /LENGTH=78 /DNA_ID=CAMNT_0008366753 /DNA_START=684 /DNA_END=917 /DNA_ORIENTATION=-
MGPDYDNKAMIFMGAFLYPQDLINNLDCFVSPNFDSAAITVLLHEIQDILYKYSHKKFNKFSKNQEFRSVFAYFDVHG